MGAWGVAPKTNWAGGWANRANCQRGMREFAQMFYDGRVTAPGMLQAPVADPRQLAPARKLLQEIFGYREFRSGQPEVIAAVLARRDTLAVMPTGGGKS